MNDILIGEGKIVFDPPNYTRKHEKQSSWKKSVLCMIPGDLCEYYAWFVRKRYNLKLNTPLRDSHLTIINDRASDAKKYEHAKKIWNGKKIRFVYHVNARTNGEHWWLRADSLDARQIRQDAGLNPDPYFNYHITLGYANSKNMAHSEYIYRQIGMFPYQHCGNSSRYGIFDRIGEILK